MSLNKWIAVLHAVITGSVFLPWSNSVVFGYAAMVSKIDLQFGFARPAGWVVILFCIAYYLTDIFFKKIDQSKIEKIKVYLVWSLVFITGFDAFSIVFLTGYGIYLPQIGLIISFVCATILVIVFNNKIHKK